MKARRRGNSYRNFSLKAAVFLKNREQTVAHDIRSLGIKEKTRNLKRKTKRNIVNLENSSRRAIWEEQ